MVHTSRRCAFCLAAVVLSRFAGEAEYFQKVSRNASCTGEMRVGHGFSGFIGLLQGRGPSAGMEKSFVGKHFLNEKSCCNERLFWSDPLYNEPP